MDNTNDGHRLGLTVLRPVSRGSFGEVYHARTKDAQLQVALKKVLVAGRSTSRQRGPCHENEAKIQSELKHANIVTLLKYCKDSDHLYLVFEWMECSLTHLLQGEKIPEAVKKTYMQMLLQALEYIHDRNIMHRDINPRNILVAASGVIKLGDFGLARQLKTTNEAMSTGYSSCAGTREYRAPELLFGCTQYDQLVDLWSCGCTCAEIYSNGRVLIHSDTDIGQLGILISVFGDPVEEGIWEGARQWPDYGKILFKASKNPPGLSGLLPNAPALFILFLQNFFHYNPIKRKSAAISLESPYFLEEPLLRSIENLPRPKSQKFAEK